MAALIIGAGAVLCVAGLRPDGPGAPPQPPAAVAPAPSPPASAPVRALPRSSPERIEIPKGDVRAPVTALGVDASGELEVPPLSRVDETGWYEHGPSPGEIGAAVIVGHVDSKTEPGVFYKLGALRPGDTFRVLRADGTKPEFEVYDVERAPKDDFPTDRVYGPTGRPEARLITCGGSFDRDTGHYSQNVIVYAYMSPTDESRTT
ncbi:class F sortase [Actinomadura sp. WMMB 499]|uniref:class F sortase n=1 Tax=Actinomadura sp. WMMB 499 TaxID=1219491 RepID=UPI0020C754CA|nr:class F sortase [Actinomadura sp. WMMB 499]